MRRAMRALAAAVLAFALWFSAVSHRTADEEAEAVEEEPTPTLPAYDDSDEIATLDERRRAEEQAAISERVRLRNAERIAAEERREEDVAIAPKISRSKPYVGQAQTYELTYYTAQCKGCTGQSASGVWVTKSTHYEGYRVLAAPKHIPFYSILRITHEDGTSYEGIVLDRGGDIVGGRLDVLSATKDEAFSNGRHKAQVQIIRRGK